jgi:hypothetical protein
MNLRRWAIGDLKAVFMDPPENLNRADEENFRNKRDIGAKGSLMESFKSLERRDKKQEQAKTKVISTKKEKKAAKAAAGTTEKGKGEVSEDVTPAAARTAARKAQRATTRKTKK